MKKLVMITQTKGGVGKSILTFLLAELHPEAMIFDMDEATKTTSMQLAYRKPKQVSFLDKDNIIDRSLFDAFLDKLSQGKSSLYIADLGASISEQLPYHLQEVKNYISDMLQDQGIELELFVVVGGANVFNQTFTHLEELHKICGNAIQIKIFKNEYFDFIGDQNEVLNAFAADNGLEVIPFTLSQTKNSSRLTSLKQLLKAGQGLSNAPLSVRYYVIDALKKLPKIKIPVA